MSLVPDYDSSSSNSSSDDTEPDNLLISNTEDNKESSPPKAKLPTPNFSGTTDNLTTNNDKTDTTTSVFSNPFIEAENAKAALLQKHVKMVESKNNVIVINGKKICWNYRKGRCRFGHNCKFAHDSDIQKTDDQLQVERQPQQTVVCQSQSLPQPTHQEIDAIKEDAVNQKKRKRPGLTQGLIPGKKVLKNYANQKI